MRKQITVLLLVGFVFLNVLLLKQNIALRASAGAQSQALLAGERVPSFEAWSAHGPVSVQFPAARKHILLFLSPNCRYCTLQLPYWRDLIRNIARDEFTVVAVAMDTEGVRLTQRYVARAGLEDLPLGFISKDVAESYRLRSTPTTIVLSQVGIVEDVWIGVWSEEALVEAREALGVPFAELR